MWLMQNADLDLVTLHFGTMYMFIIRIVCICLQDYIAVKEKHAKYLPHSAGRYQVKRFRKAQCPIVERLTDSLMMHGRNNGKKLMAMRIVKHAFEIIHLLTGEVSPIKLLISVHFGAYGNLVRDCYFL